MGELGAAAPVVGLAQKGRISAQDVAMLRREVFRDGIASRAEAEALLALDASCADKCEDWTAFLTEAVTDYLVFAEAPEGHISSANANWLTRCVSRDGRVETRTELETVIRALEKATSAPPALSAFALRQVAVAVISGDGPLASGGTLTPGVIDKPEVELIRRILHAFGGDGNVAITRAEADILFEINDRTVEEMNDPSWTDLFVKSIANFVLCASGYQAPSREEALRRDEFLDRADADVAGFFRRMVSGGLSGVLAAHREDPSGEALWAERNRRDAELADAARRVDAGEARWLADRIGRDRLLHDNERALLQFLRQEAASVHPDLKPLMNKVA